MLRKILWFAGTSIGLAALLVLLGWMVRPDVGAQAARWAYSAEEIRQARQLRENFDKFTIVREPYDAPGVDPKSMLFRKVDYPIPPAAAWYPKAQSPILDELVGEMIDDKPLPAVAERVGAEPLVLAGVEGVGTYGGTWMRAAISSGDVAILGHRLAYANLVRWSPHGYPLVPHVAKAWKVSDDNRQFTFYLRKGMKWSDGEPFTADDILYWWQEEVNCGKTHDSKINIYPSMPAIMMINGEAGTVEKLDKYTVRFSFPQPNGVFLVRLATAAGTPITNSPKHYLSQYHPVAGNKDLIRDTMATRKLADPMAVYTTVRERFNPEHPRLWPWVYRTYRSNPPQIFVRNPYYFAVDTRGNQLPYIDRVLFRVQAADMIGITAGNGELGMQARHIRYADYTHLMGNRKRSGYQLRHWYAGDRSDFMINMNINRRIDPDRPETAKKRELLNDKRFRQAMSLAIDRQAIIDTLYNGQVEPAQCAPGPASPFYEPTLYKAFTEYDPGEADRLLDEIGLTRRGRGYRTFTDGTPMTFFLDLCAFTGEGGAELMLQNWARVGVHVIMRNRHRGLFATEMAGLQHDMDVWTGNGEFLPIIQPRQFASSPGSQFARAYALWYHRGGLRGDPAANIPGAEPIPEGHVMREALRIYEATCAAPTQAEQRRLFAGALRIAAEHVWTINICSPPPTLAVVPDGLRNVPETAVYSWDFQSPGNTGIETYYFEESTDTPGAIEQTQQAIRKVTPQPDALSAAKEAPGLAVSLVKYLLLGSGVLLVALVAVRHPYIARRLLIMVPTLLIISVISFAIIQAPPGDYVTSRIVLLQMSGDEADMQRIEGLKEMFHLDEPVTTRYARWMGLKWFATFEAKDQGLLQGHLGRSMQTTKEVNRVVSDRLLLTVLISLGTIVVTWAVALPIGIYSAVKQYSVGDYVLTFIGFIGMCVPSFLLALLLIHAADAWFGMRVSGLFSSTFAAQPEWDWPKVLDLLKHVWVPIIVLGVTGTAGMIRIMRANLLDELKKPYVVTARAKGVRPMKLLLKYPVRLALNPFISGIGGLFPALVSGGAIVAMVLSLPTVGPLMLDALMNEDTYLAGSMLMILSLLGVIGTLVSDLLLLWLDPRIRFKGGAR